MRGHIKERSPGRWAIVLDVRDPDTGERKRKWHSFAGTKRQAQSECARLITEIKTGSYIEPAKTTVAEFFDIWLVHVESAVSPKTQERYSDILKLNLEPLIGSVVLSKLKTNRIDAAFAQALKTGRRDGKGGLSPRTVHHMRRVLVRCLNQAVTWDLLAKNPAIATKAPKVEIAPMVVYDAGQISELLEIAVSSRIYPAVLLAVMCGLRRGEVTALRWKHVNFETAQLSVVEATEQVKTNIRHKAPKSGHGRTVAISRTVIDELQRLRAKQAEELLQLGVRLTDESFVYAQFDGAPVKPDSLTDAWTRLTRATALPKIRFHDLRHTHATQMLAIGVNPKIASERLGHSKVGITLDLYSHVMPGMQADAAEQVDAAVRRAIKPTRK